MEIDSESSSPVRKKTSKGKKNKMTKDKPKNVTVPEDQWLSVMSFVE